MNIYILASGEITLDVLEELYASKTVNIRGLTTQTDKKARKKLIANPVSLWAEKNNIEYNKVDNVNDESFLEKLYLLNLDFIIVFSFGQLLKKTLLNLPKICCLNIHTSLLPKYRGASPIVAALLNGDEKTGVSFMHMNTSLDAGGIYASYELAISKTDNNKTLSDKLSLLAKETIIPTLTKINKQINPIEQLEENATYCYKIKKNDGLINWRTEAFVIFNQVRAYTPWPGASCQLPTNKGMLRIKITQCKVLSTSFKEGIIIPNDDNKLLIACGNNTAIEVTKLIPAGKKEMYAQDFLLGYKINYAYNLAEDNYEKIIC